MARRLRINSRRGVRLFLYIISYLLLLHGFLNTVLDCLVRTINLGPPDYELMRADWYWHVLGYTFMAISGSSLAYSMVLLYERAEKKIPFKNKAERFALLIFRIIIVIPFIIACISIILIPPDIGSECGSSIIRITRIITHIAVIQELLVLLYCTYRLFFKNRNNSSQEQHFNRMCKNVLRTIIIAICIFSAAALCLSDIINITEHNSFSIINDLLPSLSIIIGLVWTIIHHTHELLYNRNV